MNIQESNKLIAEFMQLKNGGDGTYYFPQYNSGDWHTVDDLRYHESWDWLMPVIHKINDIDHPTDGYKWFSFVILPQEISCQAGMFGGIDISISGGSRIEDAYKVVVETIQWYNQNK